jgi:ABC-type molybdate transport system substrate-binding protein
MGSSRLHHHHHSIGRGSRLLSLAPGQCDNAGLFIIALSLALSPNMKDKGRYAEISSADYLPIEQACLILKSSTQKDEARAFLNFLKTPAVSELFRKYGFATPGDSSLPQQAP